MSQVCEDDEQVLRQSYRGAACPNLGIGLSRLGQVNMLYQAPSEMRPAPKGYLYSLDRIPYPCLSELGAILLGLPRCSPARTM